MNRATDFLDHNVRVQIDRPLGTCHPERGFIYPLNYGYVLGVFEPLRAFTGQRIAIAHRLDDADDKLIVMPPDRQYSDEQIQALVEFQERFFTSIIQRIQEETI